MKIPARSGVLRTREFDSIRPKTMQLNAIVTNPDPHQSRYPFAFPLWLSGTRKDVISNATAAIGILIKKIQRHENCSTSQPPRTGPTPAAIAVKPDHVPIACPRLSFPKFALISAKLSGTRRAEPTPCAARANMSWVIFGANPHQIEARAKSTSPDKKIRLRPKLSPSEPPTRINDANMSAYDSTIHCASATVAPSSRCNTGSATLTTVPSMKVMEDPRIAAARTQRPEERPQSVTSGCERTTTSSHG